ncbi:MAG: hypothetical protein ABIH55_01545 [Nanoarchaeota archaeon]|nr:hypothetical protein [Nanoarchaeota archaeon]MBU1135493.1 hypothetical protein [Nanoarchaeota archaeon]
MIKSITIVLLLVFWIIYTMITSTFSCVDKYVTTPLIKEDVERIFQTQ